MMHATVTTTAAVAAIAIPKGFSSKTDGFSSTVESIYITEITFL